MAREQPLHYEILGHGFPLVLLPGFASDLQSWAFQRDALARKHRLVLIDNRGAGRSPSSPGPLTTVEMANDVLEVLDTARIDKAHILGHSLGGAIAQEIALLCPERVEKLLLVSTFAYGRSLPLDVLKAWQRAVQGEIDEGLLAKEVLPWIYSEEYLQHPNRIRAIIGFLKANKNPPSPRGLAGQIAALEEHDTRDRLGRIPCPTLVLGGALDRLTPTAFCRELTIGIPGAKSLTLPSAAHACMLEQADAFTQAVLEFCQA